MYVYRRRETLRDRLISTLKYKYIIIIVMSTVRLNTLGVSTRILDLRTPPPPPPLPQVPPSSESIAILLSDLYSLPFSLILICAYFYLLSKPVIGSAGYDYNFPLYKYILSVTCFSSLSDF